MAKIDALARKIDKLYSSSQTETKPQIIFDNHQVTTFNVDNVPRIFKPYPTFIKLSESNKKIKIVIGAYGSGKTSAFVNYIVEKACSMPPCADGIRRYKITFVRNTSIELASTTYQTWRDWTINLPRNLSTKKPLEEKLYFFDGKGLVELWAIFLALDREDDVRKLRSLETTDIFFNELPEINKTIFNHAESRIGRYPKKTEFDYLFDNVTRETNAQLKYDEWFPFQANILGDGNAPAGDHWIPQLESNLPDDTLILHQPPALIQDIHKNWIKNPEAENTEHLPGDYYLSMVKKGEEFVRVNACGMYGFNIDGKRVYNNYNDDLHSVDSIDYMPGHPIIIGVDYGTVSPAALVGQQVDGYVRIIKEFCCEFMTVKQLCKEVVIPYLNQYLTGYTIESVDDPANTYHGREDLIELGLSPRPAPTNKIEIRISGVTEMLDMLVGGKPKLIISRTGCPKLREGFLSKYHYRRVRVIGDERYRDEPEKNHPFSDIQDCLQYMCLHIKASISGIKLDISSFMNKEKF